ncbi:MAG: hypothetical protein FKY71_15355 [Spiribacter salinus]|uniref:Uncharacterized protein n=1 Tax=Spiribacter salinus TaxID=1335746 RepID=A0A540VN32_9GAMM|nr:MAG: hypothetical protein FKY71_15355 [Spiribacter salinus]
MYEVEDIPMPPAPKQKYPFDALEVGQAFRVPAGDSTASNLRNLAAYWGQKLSRQSGATVRFTVRQATDDTPHHTVWRLK